MEPLQLTITVSSPAFENKAAIPSKYTCEGENINPPLAIANMPPRTKSLALIVNDPDAPNGMFNHWIVWNIQPTDHIEEGSAPGIEGANDFGEIKYGGPCPPSGTHRYYFTIYALDTILDLRKGAHRKTVEEAMDGHILAAGKLVGTYKKMHKERVQD